jgi:hypothetical protein
MAGIAATALAVGVWAPLSLAGPAAVRSAEAISASTAKVYHDAVGDARYGYDITDVSVGSDLQQSLRFSVAIPSQAAQGSDEDVELLVDTDNNPSTGENGAEVDIQRNLSGDVRLSRWNGKAWRPQEPQPPMAVSYVNGVFSIDILNKYLRAGNTFGFKAAAFKFINHVAHVDDQAPDIGFWKFTFPQTARTPSVGVHALPDHRYARLR